MKYLYMLVASLLLASCGTKYNEMQECLTQMEGNEENYDTPTTDSLALEVVTYMDMHGTPEDRLRAWRQVGKVFHRMGNGGYRNEAYKMAVASIDTTQAFDKTLFALTLSEQAQALAWTLRPEESRATTFRAIALAEAAGDTVTAMYIRGTNYGNFHTDTTSGFTVAREAYDYLWEHRYYQQAVDAYGAALFMSIDGYEPDTFHMHLDRLVKHTKHNITDPHSWWTREYLLARGTVYQRQENRDSCIHYFKKLAEADMKGVKVPGIRGLSHLADAYGHWGDTLQAKQCGEQIMEISYHNQQLRQDNDSKILTQVYQSMHAQMAKDEAADRKGVMILLASIVALTLVLFLLYRQRMMKRQHRELLQQNGEYAALLASLQTKDTILESPIVKRIHELSAHDAHPSDEEWLQLQALIDKQYPLLFPSLQKDYTMTEQEKRAVCLIVAKCTPSQMSVLLVYSKGNVSNLRRRLYAKLTGEDGKGTDLDEMVNGLCR
ncbi:MAG: hypothetical protein KBT39_11940 [Bacteroidales bacterium]|nr:hypothetical protein [Bacteroidales bacterium]